MFANLKAWWNNPYSPSMSAVGWFLFIGLLLVVLAVWGIVTSHLRAAVD